jgi:alkaline phosphatase
MSTKRCTLLLVGLAAAIPLALGTPSRADAPAQAAENPKPLAKNVILLIDDGAGYNHHAAGSMYDTGLAEGEAYNDFPFQKAVSTYSYGDVEVGDCPTEPTGYDPAAAWSTWEYVINDPTDSASSATAMSTGVKTYDKGIGMDCLGTRLTHLTAVLEGMGKATGVVSSGAISAATPAAFVGHNLDREASPALAREMIEQSATDVIMGSGSPDFDRQGVLVPTPTPPGANRFQFIPSAVWTRLKAGTAGDAVDADADGITDPFTLVQTRAEFEALTTGPTPDRVAGVAQVRRNLQVDRAGDAAAAPYTVPFIQTVPELSTMTAAALNILDNDPDGFFLMSEGAATDTAAHGNWAGRMIEEEVSFDRSVDTVLQWVDQHSNWGETLVIVVSDHETGYVTGPDSGPTDQGPVWTPLVNNGKGAMPGLEFNLAVHTNSLVPVFAKGDAGRLLRTLVDGTDPVRGDYVDNTDIYQLMLRAVGASDGSE